MCLGEVVFKWKACFSQLPYEGGLSPHLPHQSLEGRVLAPGREWSGLVCSVLCAWAGEAAAALVQLVPYSALEGTYLGRVTVAGLLQLLSRWRESLESLSMAKGNRQPLKADVFLALFKRRGGSELERRESRARAGLVSKLL